eukprot:715656_1
MLSFQAVLFFIIIDFKWTCATEYIDHVTTSTSGSFNFILNKNDNIFSTSRSTWLVMQEADGHLVLYNGPGNAIWATHILGAEIVELDRNGNLMVKMYLIPSYGNQTQVDTMPHSLII